MVTKKDAGKGKDLWRLRLYLNKAAPKALRTETLLKGHLDVLLPGQYEIEILDVKSDIEKALADQIIATPTLIRLAPAPSKKIIGDFADRDQVAASLDVTPGGSI